MVHLSRAMTQSTRDFFRSTASQAVVFRQPASSVAGIAKNSSLTATAVTGVCVDGSFTFAAVAFAQFFGIWIVPIAVTATVSTSD